MESCILFLSTILYFPDSSKVYWISSISFPIYLFLCRLIRSQKKPTIISNIFSFVFNSWGHFLLKRILLFEVFNFLNSSRVKGASNINYIAYVVYFVACISVPFVILYPMICLDWVVLSKFSLSVVRAHTKSFLFLVATFRSISNAAISLLYRDAISCSFVSLTILFMHESRSSAFIIFVSVSFFIVDSFSISDPYFPANSVLFIWHTLWGPFRLMHLHIRFCKCCSVFLFVSLWFQYFQLHLKLYVD